MLVRIIFTKRTFDYEPFTVNCVKSLYFDAWYFVFGNFIWYHTQLELIWYNLLPFGVYLLIKKWTLHNPPFITSNANPCVCVCVYTFDLTLLSYYIGTKPYYSSMVHCLICPTNVFTFTCGSLHDISILLYTTLLGIRMQVLVWNTRPFRQPKVKYYSLFGKVLNYIYSFVYANKAIWKVSLFDNISGINSPTHSTLQEKRTLNNLPMFLPLPRCLSPRNLLGLNTHTYIQLYNKNVFCSKSD